MRVAICKRSHVSKMSAPCSMAGPHGSVIAAEATVDQVKARLCSKPHPSWAPLLPSLPCWLLLGAFSQCSASWGLTVRCLLCARYPGGSSQPSPEEGVPHTPPLATEGLSGSSLVGSPVGQSIICMGPHLASEQGHCLSLSLVSAPPITGKQGPAIWVHMAGGVYGLHVCSDNSVTWLSSLR